MIINLWCFFM